MRPAFVVDGRPLRLGARIGKGGEGEVFAVADSATLAAKIYAAEGAATRETKIAAMVRARLADRAPLVAFPIAEIRRKDGRFAGFLMPRVDDAEPLHELYAPGARKRAFPEADFRFIARAALNAARSVAAAHKAGCVIGDVNHSGFLIGQDALVTLIDADSFQIDDGLERHLCRVGVPEYTPPELIGQPLSGVVRTPDHDAFGLAVVLFQLLFMGRHPFAGVADEDIPVAEAIARDAFAYTRRRASGLAPPPGAARLDDVPAPVADLFERAFAPGAAGRRPAAADWVAALEAFEAALVACAAQPRHFHAQGLACPWCRLEAASGAALFPDPAAAPPDFDATRLAARLAEIETPEVFSYAPPQPHPDPYPPPTAGRLWLRRATVAFHTLAMGAGAYLFVVSPQSFMMAVATWGFGFAPVRDALTPRRAAERALAAVDRRLVGAIADVQFRAPIDAAHVLRAEIEAAMAERAAEAGRLADDAALKRRRRAPSSPKLRNLDARLARDVARLADLAEAVARVRTTRDERVDDLLRRRGALVRDLAALGGAPPPPPETPPRTIGEAARRRARGIAAQQGAAASVH
ncbi:MAG: hypothetical protein EA355_01485 [Rhodobacteraceae bacterium]|nr:MAG: hypothetical protein EA355_01485 [Paracoccaceae bacterium]